MQEKILLNSQEIDIIITRLCWQLIEVHQDFENTCFVGLQPRGVFFADRIIKKLKEITGKDHFTYGKLDITFFRDDFRRREELLVPNQTEINFVVENKNVIFIDDVLYSGRSVRSALSAINTFGRAAQIELLTLINRRFSKELPIVAKYIGKEVDAIKSEKVKVSWKEQGGEDLVTLISKGHE
ncbi:MAG: bifunctional pyr operon transcriptional regulator/uracil phosphoribosyltransferase PyrR [Flavobacteriales bacterium]|nr:bifunctional pyr operon transcriptional regulator/uracil phosphoribosyltransferase PyrR [Flavobacteriales bacterium]